MASILTRIKLRSKTSDEWDIIKNTDIPLDGEYCIVSDLNKAKIGNGVDTFFDLPWHNVTPEELTELQAQIEKNALYTTTVPTVNAFGGIPAGWTCEDMSVRDVLDQLLHPWVAPVVSASVSPNGGVREKGNAVTVSSVRVSVTPKSSSISKIDIYNSQASGAVIATLSDGVSSGGTFDISINPVTIDSVNTYFTAKVTDGATKVTSANTGTFTFVYPYYYGAVTDAAPTADIITALTKKVETKGTKKYAFTADNARACFAYPKSYGVIKQILDANGFNVTDTFSLTEVEIVGLDDTAQIYYVYTANTASTITNFNFQFSY